MDWKMDAGITHARKRRPCQEGIKKSRALGHGSVYRGSVAADVQARLDQIPRPVGYDLNVAGNSEKQQKAFRELVISPEPLLIFQK